MLPDGFWQLFGPNRCSCDGLVRETTLDQSSFVGDHFFEAGSFSHDICLKQEEKATETVVINRRSGSYGPSILLFVRLIYVVLYSIRRFDQSLQFTAHGILLDSKFVYHIWQVACHGIGKGRQHFTCGEFVSISAPVDRPRKCVRIKSTNEYPRNNTSKH